MRLGPSKFNVLFVFCFFAVLLLIKLSIFAVPRNSPRPWDSNASGSLGNVNLFNGTLNLGLPLLHAGGRGDVEIPLSLRLNSSWAQMYYTYVTNNGYSGSRPVQCKLDEEGWAPSITDCVDFQGYSTSSPEMQPVHLMVFPRLDDQNGTVKNNSGGLGLEYGPGTLAFRTMVGSSITCDFPIVLGQLPTHAVRPNATRLYMTFTASDGSSHELVDQNTMGKFRVNSDNRCDQQSPDSTFSRGNNFVSTDGTAITFVSDTEITYDQITNDSYGDSWQVGVSGNLYEPGGTVYRIDEGAISSIKDRNGNITTYTYYTADPNTSTPKRLHQIIDSIGRTVSIEYDVPDGEPYGLCDRITYGGIGGSP